MSDTHEYITIELDPAVPDDALDRYPGELRQAMLIRRTEERLLELFSQGKLFGTVHTCIGQEFVAIAVARALRPEDTIFSNHRGHGHFLAYCGNVVGLIGEVMGKSIGVCGGRGGSQHLQQDNYYSNGIQGGIVPVATGLGLAHRLRRTGGVSVVFVGDGTLGQGALYESMNIASLWDLPVLFVCENNLVAQSTSQTQTLAGDICARAAAFGIETAHGNTWDWPRLFDQIRHSVDRVRETSRPLFHRVDTFRLKAHSKGDDNRPSSYVAEHERRDPIYALSERYGSDPRWVRMVAEIQERIDDATSRADAADFDTLEPGAVWKGPREHFWTARPFERERIVQSVRRGLQDGLAAHSGMILIGEDVESPYGGAFKCTAGLSDEFPGRVRNTPISELALAGLGNGLALGGLKPVVEIMFGDFMTLTADQWINHASKFRFMFNDKVRVPVVLRTPMGGKRGYAATHSQTIEKHFLGLPDTQVLCLHHRDSPERLYRALFETVDRPTLVIENKTLYGQYCSSDPPPGYDLVFSDGEAFPTARLKPKGPPDLTIVAIGGMSIEAEQALALLFKEDEIAVDLFLPTRLYPFDADIFESSLRTSRRLLVVEEGLAFASLSSEILAQVVERYGQRGLVCRRVNAAALPIPAARPLEQECLPDTAAIVRMAREIMRELVH